jgi:hypothetical protein
MSALRRAEAIAPQHLRSSADAKTAVRTLLMAPRVGRSQDLRELADSINLAD